MTIAIDPTLSANWSEPDTSWGTGVSADSSGSSGGSWWQDTLGFVIKAAAVDRYTQKPLQGTGQYQLDQFGNLVPMGSGVRVTGTTSINNNLVMYAALALGAMFLYSMAKD